MKVKIKKLSPYAKIPFKTYENDFCYDCVATSCEEIAPNIYKYKLGIAMQIDRNEDNPFATLYFLSQSQALERKDVAYQLSIDARPRSSVWKTGMVLSNCEGTIDESFTGEISAVFYHVLPNMPKYEVGDKIIQIKLGLTLPVDFVEVEELAKTARGDGSYGSTGR